MTTREEFLRRLTDYATNSVLKNGRTLTTIVTLHANNKMNFVLSTGLPEFSRARQLMRILGATVALDVDSRVTGVGFINEALMQVHDDVPELPILNITVRLINEQDAHRIFRIHQQGEMIDLRPLKLPGIDSQMSSLLDELVQGYVQSRYYPKNNHSLGRVLS